MPPPTGILFPLNLAGETTLKAVTTETNIPIALPTYPPGLGPPDHLFLQQIAAPVVIMAWRDPEVPQDIALSLFIIDDATMPLATAVSAVAGGWAEIELHTTPEEITAGKPWPVEFTVWEHGETPVHTLFDGQPVRPVLQATHMETGETVRAEAVPAGETGRFTLAVTFPTAGNWSWSLAPEPLIGVTTFSPLTVAKAPAPPAGKSSKAGTALTGAPVSPAPAGIPADFGTTSWLFLLPAGMVLLFLAFRVVRPRWITSPPASGSSSPR